MHVWGGRGGGGGGGGNQCLAGLVASSMAERPDAEKERHCWDLK